MVYQKGETENDNTSIVKRASADGATWSGETVLITANAGEATKGPTLLKTSGGTVWLVYNRIDIDPVTRLGVFYRTSTDDGETWSAEGEIETSYSDAAIGGPMVELENGNLIQPFWGSAGGAIDTAIMRSTDGGETWGGEVLAADGSVDGRLYYEPNMIQLANGDLLCLMREESGAGECWKTTSNDNGATWSAASLAFTSCQSAARLTQLSDGTVITVFRVAAGAGATTIRTSSDNGAAWSDGQLVMQDDHNCTYGCIAELSGNRVVVAYGAKWAVDDGSIHAAVLDFAELP